MKNIIYLSAFALLTVSVSACNDNKKGKNYNNSTLVDSEAASFIKQASEAGMTEIQAATIAQSKSNNPRVKAFAQMMIKDHSDLDAKIRKIADDKFVSIKSASDTLSLEHQQMISSVSKLSGTAFDKAYMQMMVTDHGKVIELFKTMLSNKNKVLNRFAEKNLPVLMKHSDSAKAISSSL